MFLLSKKKLIETKKKIFTDRKNKQTHERLTMSNNKYPYESEFWVFLWHFFPHPDRFSMFVPSLW